MRKNNKKKTELYKIIRQQIEEIDNKIRELALDMIDTMYKYDGVGLAAPQVGILKRIIVIDPGTGPRVLINPVITKKSGYQTGEEGCLSSLLTINCESRIKKNNKSLKSY